MKALMADGRLQLNKTADELRAALEAGVLIKHLNKNAVLGLRKYAKARGFAVEIPLVGQSGPPHKPKVAHDQELQSLEASLSGRIEALTLNENRSKQLAEMSQKDSQTLDLEQERLKVLLRMKTKQLHWQEKKMLQIDKLTKKSVKMMRASRRART